MTKPRGGPSKKAPGTAVSARNGQRIMLTKPGVPHPIPEHIEHPKALEAWAKYWEDPISSLISKTDRPMLDRWIDLVQRYWRLSEEADANPTFTANTGYQVASNLFPVIAAVEQAIERLETRLGIGPKARAALGIAIIKLDKENDPNTGLPRPQQPEPEDDEEIDPRLAG